MVLAHRREACAAVDLAGRREDDLLELVLSRGDQDVERPDRVHVDDLARVDVRIRDADERREVEDDFGLLDEAANRVEFRDVAVLDAKFAIEAPKFEQAPLVARVVAHEGRHLGAELGQ